MPAAAARAAAAGPQLQASAGGAVRSPLGKLALPAVELLSLRAALARRETGRRANKGTDRAQRVRNVARWAIHDEQNGRWQVALRSSVH